MKARSKKSSSPFPEECLILTMQLNQKYFALRDAEGRLMNRFLLVSQLEAKDGGAAISSGNARVVRARLADAKFFYDQDRQEKLETRVDGLKHVVYHNKLGSQAERMLRVKTMAGLFADLIGARSRQGRTRRHARQGRPPHADGRRVPRTPGHHGRVLRQV